MTRILYLSADPGIPVLGGKGASVHLRAVARALDALGAHVLVASPRCATGNEQVDRSIELIGITAVLPKEHSSVNSLGDAVERPVQVGGRELHPRGLRVVGHAAKRAGHHEADEHHHHRQYRQSVQEPHQRAQEYHRSDCGHSRRAEAIDWQPDELRGHARKFDRQVFREQLQQFVGESIAAHAAGTRFA